jgi:EAL domain-containing protein (putative c-di-GMP-specific phosphodiesterase class I)
VERNVTEYHRACAEKFPFVLVVDLQMPDMDGLEILRELAQRKCSSKIVVVSGMDRRLLDTARRLGTELGLRMAGALEKPVRAAALKDMLSSIRLSDGELTASALSDGIAAGRLMLVYQPKVDIITRQVVGVEALARLRDERGRIIPPDVFIPLAERTDLIDPLTNWVAEHAIDQAGRWRRAGMSLQVAVNLSAKNIHDRQLPDLIATKCRMAEVPPETITLELTETAAMQDVATLLEVLGRFRLKGFHLSIDDFGTGYSSIAQLMKLPFTELKIDKSFVTEMDRARDAAIVTKTIIDLARNLGLATVAEGVEGEAALGMLTEFGCEVAQGYLFSRPVEADAIGTAATSLTRGQNQ